MRCWLARLPRDCLVPATRFNCKVAPCPVLLEPRLHTDGLASSLSPFPAILPAVVRRGSETAPSSCPVAHQCWPMESTSEQEPLCPQRPLFAGHLPLPGLCPSATKLGHVSMGTASAQGFLQPAVPSWASVAAPLQGGLSPSQQPARFWDLSAHPSPPSDWSTGHVTGWAPLPTHPRLRTSCS